MALQWAVSHEDCYLPKGPQDARSIRHRSPGLPECLMAAGATRKGVVLTYCAWIKGLQGPSNSNNNSSNSNKVGGSVGTASLGTARKPCFEAQGTYDLLGKEY